MRVCDHSHQGFDHGILRKSDGEPYHAMRDEVSEARNCQLLKDMRLDMLAGRWHPTCARCRDEYAADLVPRNHRERDLWQAEINLEKAQASTAIDGTVDLETSPIRHYELAFGNRCNLKCRSCGPSGSDFWYEDHINLWGNNTFRDAGHTRMIIRNDRGKLLLDTDSYDWHDGQRFWQHIENNAHNIRHIHMGGSGEPLLIDNHYRLLSLCCDLGISRGITIEYNSNIVKIPSKAWDMWANFREVRIGASIDAIGPMNEYIRYPAKWNSVEDNLRRFDSSTDINFNVWLASTVMIYNVWYMPEMLEWVLRSRFDRIAWTPGVPLIFFHPLSKPSFLSARMLPQKIKKAVADKYRTSQGKLCDLALDIYPDDPIKSEALLTGIPQNLNRWITWLLDTDMPDEMAKFWRYTDGLDQLRGESMSQVMPEWHDMLRFHA